MRRDDVRPDEVIRRAAVLWGVDEKRAIQIIDEMGLDPWTLPYSEADLIALRAAHRDTLIGAMGELRAAWRPIPLALRDAVESMPWWLQAAFVVSGLYIVFFWPT